MRPATLLPACALLAVALLWAPRAHSQPVGTPVPAAPAPSAVGTPVPPPPGQAAAASDPPARVGRLSLVEGRVDLFTDDSTDWEPAPMNMPVTSRTSLWVGPDGRAEVRVGASALRLDHDTQANITQLDDSGLALELVRGSVGLRTRNLAGGDRVAVAAQGLRFTPQAGGLYRVDFDADSQRLTVQVFAGRGTLAAGRAQLAVGAGQQASADGVAQTVAGLGEARRSAFDDWGVQRDRRSARAPATAYVPPEMTGADTLDDHGEWRVEPAQGAVWYPAAVSVGWAPYRYGRWRWVSPWGWTWIDDAPWGFAPFHYGRWLFIGGRWGWAPGSFAVGVSAPRPVYAPALVGFYGSGWSVGVGVGVAPVVGWFPLAPGEVFRPGYAATIGYVRNLNVTTVTNVSVVGAADAAPPTFRYAQTSFAATVVPQRAFESAQPVPGAQLNLPPAKLAQAPVAGTAATPAPRAAVRPRDNAAPAATAAADVDRADRTGRADRADRVDRAGSTEALAARGPAGRAAQRAEERRAQRQAMKAAAREPGAPAPRRPSPLDRAAVPPHPPKHPAAEHRRERL